MLLFGLTGQQIAQLKLSDVTCDDERVLLRIGSTPVALPEPVAAMTKTLLAEPRYRHNTAAHPHSPWLFPGRNPGRPMHIGSIHDMLDAADVPLRTSRAGTWQQLVREAPPAILAEALGITATTAMRYATTAGTDYLSYPARTRD